MLNYAKCHTSHSITRRRKIHFPFTNKKAIFLPKTKKVNFFSSSSPLPFQDDHKAFRRQLEDKRPVVESNLLSGRQYVASEPPVSDASDSEGKFIPLKLKV